MLNRGSMDPLGIRAEGGVREEYKNKVIYPFKGIHGSNSSSTL